MTENDIREKIGQVIAALGWQTVNDGATYAYPFKEAQTLDGLRVMFLAHYPLYKQNRIEVRQVIDHNLLRDVSAPYITVNAPRPTRNIVADIERRLLPRAREVAQLEAQARARQQREDAAWQEAVARLAAYGIRQTPDGAIYPPLDGPISSIELNADGSRAYIKMYGIATDDLIRLLDCLAKRP